MEPKLILVTLKLLYGVIWKIYYSFSRKNSTGVCYLHVRFSANYSKANWWSNKVVIIIIVVYLFASNVLKMAGYFFSERSFSVPYYQQIISSAIGQF